MKCKYKSAIKLRGRENGRSYYFQEETVYLHAIPFRPAEDMEDPPRGMYLRAPQLGEWGGSLLVPFGAGIQNHFGKYWLETDKHRGDIWIEGAGNIHADIVELLFYGSGDLISIELETELKKMLYKP